MTLPRRPSARVATRTDPPPASSDAEVPSPPHALTGLDESLVLQRLTDATLPPKNQATRFRLAVRSMFQEQAASLVRKSRTKTSPNEGHIVKYVATLHGFVPASVAVTFDVMHPQQQLSWEADIMEEDDANLALPAGSSSLMCYPTVCTLLDPQGVAASQAGGRVLRQMVICLALETDAFDKCDGVGANPIHALLVCNTPESLALSMELYRLCPRLLTQLHAPTGPSRARAVCT